MTTNTTKAPAIAADIDFPSPSIGRLCLTFSHGEQLEIRTDRLNADILLQATLHGLKQKLVDAAAISRNIETGRSATAADKFAAVKEVYDRLLSGEWNKRREGGGTATAGGLLFRALCRMYEGKKSAEDIRAFLDGKTDAEKAALRKNAKVAVIIEELRAESAKGDAAIGEDILADLEGS